MYQTALACDVIVCSAGCDAKTHHRKNNFALAQTAAPHILAWAPRPVVFTPSSPPIGCKVDATTTRTDPASLSSANADQIAADVARMGPDKRRLYRLGDAHRSRRPSACHPAIVGDPQRCPKSPVEIVLAGPAPRSPSSGR